jgi:hypothetical protein
LEVAPPVSRFLRRAARESILGSPNAVMMTDEAQIGNQFT